jgi:hypothetical protein
MRRTIPLLMLITLLSCEMKDFIGLVTAQLPCMMVCTEEMKKECSEGKVPACCRILCSGCIYMLPETYSFSDDLTIVFPYCITDDKLVSFYVFDAFRPPEEC